MKVTIRTRFCETCGERLTSGARRWHQGCIPSSWHRDNLHRANRLACQRRQRARFGAAIGRVMSVRGTLTNADLIDLLVEARKEGWRAGYSCRESHCRRHCREERA